MKTERRKFKCGARVSSRRQLTTCTGLCTYFWVGSQLLPRREKTRVTSPNKRQRGHLRDNTCPWGPLPLSLSSTCRQPDAQTVTPHRPTLHEYNALCACEHTAPDNSTTTTAWRISFLLICTRLHEFELVPYIIINLPHKTGSARSFVCFLNVADMTPRHSRCVHAATGCRGAYRTGTSPSPRSPDRPLSDFGSGSMISSAQLSHDDLSCHRVLVGAHCRAGACATHAAWWGSRSSLMIGGLDFVRTPTWASVGCGNPSLPVKDRR